MRCRACEIDYPPGLLFCEECGISLAEACPACESAVKPGQKFCGHCGARLEGNAVSPPVSAAPALPTASVVAFRGERRPLTVMFCDLVGSTALAASMDGEEWRDIVKSYHATVVDQVTRFGGHVAQRFGDGALVYFGYPRASENDAERAVRAGLGIVEAVAALKNNIKVRVGIHAGLVVLDSGGEIFGDVANIAARVEGAAAAGEVVISADVYRLTADLLVAERRGLQPLRGVTEPIELFRVIRIDGAGQRRNRARAPSGIVGREEELRQIGDHWQRAKSGAGRTILLLGEPGVGKSRLIDEFCERAGILAPIEIEWQCVQLLSMTPFHPLAQWAKQALGGPDATPPQRAQLLLAELDGLGLDASELMPLIAPLMDLPVPPGYPKLAVSPEERRRRQLDALLKWLLAGTRSRPTFLVVEDLHWADPSTLDLLRLLSARNAVTPMLLLLSARVEFKPNWVLQPHHSIITLTPLRDEDVRALVADIVARGSMAKDLVDSVVARSGGVPLFVEEVTRLLLDSRRIAGETQIPLTLQASLTARIDQLGPEKELAQIGSVLGREFSWELIQALAQLEDSSLRDGLERLEQLGLIATAGFPPDATYRFKHALIQDAAYEVMLKSRRKELHRATAAALARQSKSLVRLEVLAHHLTEAGDNAAALTAWERAGDSALDRTAFVEAAAHFRRAIDILTQFPDDRQHTLDNFRLRGKLADCYRASKGFANPETRRALDDAWHAGQQIATPESQAALLARMVTAAYHDTDFTAAQSFADRLSVLAQESGGSFELGWAKTQQAILGFCQGDLALAVRLLAEAETHLAACGNGDKGAIDPSVIVNLFKVYSLTHRGRLDEAGQVAMLGLAESERIGGPYNLAWAKVAAGYHLNLIGDIDGARHHAVALQKLSDKYGLPQFSGYGHLWLGAALLGSESPQQASTEIAAGIEKLRQVGSKLWSNMFLAWQAEARAAEGMLTEALGKARAAAELARCAPIYRPDVNRVLAGILRRTAALLQGSTAQDFEAEARSAYRSAIAEACATDNLLPALRAATDFARWQGQSGNRAAARETLAPVHALFAEGFTTRPLVEASALLDQLASGL